MTLMVNMTNSHTQNFFGQKTGLIFSTNKKEESFMFIRCLKKKKNGEWQKFNESKVVKISLLETISILDVLNGKRKIWNTFHSFNNTKTPISFAWDEYDSELLWINIDDYSRPLNYPETELLKRLIKHIVNEKIEFATIRKELRTENNGTAIREQPVKIENTNRNYRSEKSIREPSSKNYKGYSTTPKNNKSNNVNIKNNMSEDDFASLRGKIKMAREKAILLILDNQEEIWLPKSTIKGDYDLNTSDSQNFIVKKWILEKRNLASA